MIKRFEIELYDGARVITLWSPLELMVPTRTEFRSLYAKSRLTTQKTYQNKLKQFVLLVSILVSWLLADRYICALEVVPGEYRRFLNMLYSMIIWINAWNSGVACENRNSPQ
jgi:hypothetical protein